MRSRFAAWLRSLDPAARKPSSSPLLWASTAGLALLIMVVAGLAPVTSAFFRLDFVPALIASIPPILVGTIGGFLERSNKLSLAGYGIVALVNSALMQFYLASLVAFSEPPGSAVLASLLVLTAGNHGYIHRASTRFPFALFATLIGVLGALFLIRTTQNYYVFAVMGPVSIGATWMLGEIALATSASREKERSMMAAIQARDLDDRARALDRLAETVVSLLQLNHDLATLLSGARFNATGVREVLGERVEGDPALKGSFDDLEGSLGSIGRIVDEIRALGLRHAPAAQAAEEVALWPVLDECMRMMRARYPSVSFELDTDDSVHTCVVQGGELSLKRVLENLLANACQGDGAEKDTTRVRVVLRTLPDMIDLKIVDDGPGFSPEMLDHSLEPFRTTKRGGTGLGLYTAQRIVMASGGTIEIGNSEDFGGTVRLRFRRGER